jgi:hypothetical protein
MPRFSPAPWGLETVPSSASAIRSGNLSSPIVDVSFGPGSEADFLPAARLARNLGEDRFIGLEYYADHGKVGNILPLRQQDQQLYTVTDFKVKHVDVELGVGYHFTPGSDHNKDDNGGSNSSMTMGTQPRTTQNYFFVK